MECESDAPINKKQRIKPKVNKEWEEEDVFKLITLVESEKCLWDASDEGYHNKTLRDCAWRNIGEHFNDKYGITDLNAKWTNLRIQFRGYASRAKTKSGQGAIEAPKWRYFNALNFIGRAEDQQTQQTISNIMVDIEIDSNSLENSMSSTSPLLTQRKKITTRRPLVEDSQSAASQIAETMREAINAMKERNENALNPNTTFSNFLLSELNMLSQETAAIVRKRVTLFFFQCVEEAKLNELPN